MFSFSNLLRAFLWSELYIWVDVFLFKETQKAILIEFDGRTCWFPKAWILRMKHNNDSDTVRIKISQYHWEKKFW